MRFKSFTIYSLFLVLIVTNSCWDHKAGIPEDAVNAIPPDSLIKIIFEVHRADALLMSNAVKIEGEKIDSIMYESVFKNYPYTKQDFENTLKYYVYYNLDSLNLIYSRVLEKLYLEKGKEM